MHIVAFVLAVLFLTLPSEGAASCSASKRNEILAPANSSQSEVFLDCNLELLSSDVVTKRIIIQGSVSSGVTLNCNNALINTGSGTVNQGKDGIEIRSRKSFSGGVAVWDRPENVTVRNCRINGSLRVWGMGRNHEGADLYWPSRQSNFVNVVRSNAPRNIILNNLHIKSDSRTPLYIAPGVTYVTLSNSELEGIADSVAIYFDGQSGFNTIKNNTIRTDTSPNNRELIAVDGTEKNLIINNRFSNLDEGGLFLYRNCGEAGVVRHTTPNSNQIINNAFFYLNYTGPNPSVFFGERNGNRSYCNDDAGYPFGSSASNLDFAQNNVFMQNIIYNRDINEMIKFSGLSTDTPNFVAHNERVNKSTFDPITRNAGCYVEDGFATNFILDGEYINVFDDGSGNPQCRGHRLTCNDGILNQSSDNNCNFSSLDLDCQVTGNNSGCFKNVYCPAGQSVLSAKAACNLEFGTVSSSEVSATPKSTLRVVKESDTRNDGSCYVDFENQISSGSKIIEDILGQDKVAIFCREQDANGGDCHIRGKLYCQ